MEVIKATIEGLSGEKGSAGFYNALYGIYTTFGVLGPLTFFIDAPFGRFAMEKAYLNINGNFGWLVMEVVSPVVFVLSLLSQPLTSSGQGLSTVFSPSLDRFHSFSTPTKILSSLYFVHYLNRAIISPLRSPARSPMHISVPISAIIFNFFNGYLMGSWLGGRTAGDSAVAGGGAVGERGLESTVFWVGVGVWGLGFVGNLVHDEVLYNLRRPSKKSGSSKASTGKGKGDRKDGEDGSEAKPPRYSIPHGLLYDFPLGGVSYPAYFCEWIEWIGFALAASSTLSLLPPALAPTSTTTTSWISSTAKPLLSSLFKGGRVLDDTTLLGWARNVTPTSFLTPPWLFAFTEVLLMSPRAYKGHLWYRNKFEGKYPSGRKVVIPGLF